MWGAGPMGAGPMGAGPMGAYGMWGGYSGAGAYGAMGYGGQQQQQQQGKKKKKGKPEQQHQQQQQQQPAAGPGVSPAVAGGKSGESAIGSAETTSQPAAKQMDSSEWPPALKAYVSRCFNQCVTDVDKDQVEIILKGTVPHYHSVFTDILRFSEFFNIFVQPRKFGIIGTIFIFR